MKKLFLLSFFVLLQSCTQEKTNIEFDNETKTITVLSENYRFKHILINEMENGKQLDSVYSSVDIDRQLTKINLLSLSKNDSLYGMEMIELLKRKNLDFKIALVSDSLRNKRRSLSLIHFNSSDIKNKNQIFESY